MNLLFRDGTTLNVQTPATMIGVIVGLLIALVVLSGCSNPVEEDYCPVVETGEVLWGASDFSTGIWYGIGVDDRTEAEVGMHVSVLTPSGQGMHRFHIDFIDTETVDGVAFLIDNNSTAGVPSQWGENTYELVDCR